MNLETLKLLGENIGNIIQDTGVVEDFLNMLFLPKNQGQLISEIHKSKKLPHS